MACLWFWNGNITETLAFSRLRCLIFIDSDMWNQTKHLPEQTTDSRRGGNPLSYCSASLRQHPAITLDVVFTSSPPTDLHFTIANERKELPAVLHCFPLLSAWPRRPWHRNHTVRYLGFSCFLQAQNAVSNTPLSYFMVLNSIKSTENVLFSDLSSQ